MSQSVTKSIYGTIVWFVTTLFVVYAFSLNTAAAVFADTVKETLHTTNVGAAYATGAFIVGFACMQISAGYLLDKYSARFVVAFGVLLLALGNFAISFTNSLWLFSLANLVQGFGASFAFIAAGTLIAQWFRPRLFPILFGATQTLSCVLSGFIHFFFSYELKVHPWNKIYLMLSLSGFALFVLTILLVKNPADQQRGEALSLGQSLKKVCHRQQIWLCAIAAATSFGVLLAYASFWYLKVQHFHDVSSTQSLYISAIIFAGVGIGTPILGWISNLVKSRIMIIHLSLALGVMTLLLGLYLPHFKINSLIITKIISFLIGFFLSGSMLFYTIVSEIITNAQRGVALSITNTGVFLFNTLLLFIPYFLTTSSVYYTSLWILPFCIMISISLLYFVNETYSAQDDAV